MSFLYRTATKKIFISFDYDNDRHLRYLLSALKENSGYAIDFIDVTPGEIATDSVSRVKAVLTSKITSATHTLVIVGAQANHYHKDRELIGHRNWQWWEVVKSKELGKKFIAVKTLSTNSMPEPLLGAGATLVHSFKVDPILSAISGL